jgi:hypothetical protein
MNNSAGNASEVNIARKIYIPGTLSNLNAHFADTNGTSRVVQSRVNSANGNMSVAPTNGTSGYFADTVHSDHLANATDTFDWTATYATANPFLQFVVFNYAADSGHTAIYSTGQLGIGTTSALYLGPFGGASNTSNTVEANAQFTIRVPGTYANLTSIVNSPVASTATLVSRKNGVTGNMTLTIPLNTTGYFEDNTHSDTLASGDLYCLQMTGQSASGLQFQSATFTASVIKNDICAAGNPAFTASATASYIPIVGSISVETTEANASVRHGFNGYCSNLRVRLTANTLTGTASIFLRKNNANGNQTLSITAGATGVFEDTTHIDAFTANDDINLSVINGTSGAITFAINGLTETPPFPINASFAGAGNLSAATRMAMQVSSSFAGAGNLSAQVALRLQAAATFTGLGGLSAQLSLFLQATALFAGSGSLSAQLLRVIQAATNFAGVGGLSVGTQLALTGFASFNGAGLLQVSVVSALAAQARFQGLGALSVAAVRTAFALAVFNGAGSLRASMIGAIGASALFVGAGNLNVFLQRTTSATATFQGAGLLVFSSEHALFATAQFDGAGDLSVLVFLQLTAAATFIGTSEMCIQAYNRLGPKGAQSNKVVAGPGPTQNRIAWGRT